MIGAQLERNPHSKTEGGEKTKLTQRENIVSREGSFSINYTDLTKYMKTYIIRNQYKKSTKIIDQLEPQQKDTSGQ